MLMMPLLPQPKKEIKATFKGIQFNIRMEYLLVIEQPLVYSSLCKHALQCCSNRFVTGASGTAADTVDDKVEGSSFMLGHGTEDVGAAHVVTEVLPAIVGTFIGALSLSGCGTVACLLTRTEILDEAVCGGRWCSNQGVGCGQCCSK
jgi:hypothetical protein